MLGRAARQEVILLPGFAVALALISPLNSKVFSVNRPVSGLNVFGVATLSCSVTQPL